MNGQELHAKKSCRAKYDAGAAHLLGAMPEICPPCLGAAQQATLGTRAERAVDDARGSIYCAGTQPLS